MILSLNTKGDVMIDEEQLKWEVIVPVLKYLAPDVPYSDAAVELLFGTASVESKRGTYLKQLGGGPALGIYQMEPATYNDIYQNFLQYKPSLLAKVEKLRGNNVLGSSEKELIGNLYYATAMARIHYYRVPEPLPKTPEAHAAYWKEHYNTILGAGTPEKYMEALSL